ncbi:MAG: DUF3857 domain-containing protein [Verrucomicrobiales bacterium]|nr:DUF3857 domain-containing protein [Verrucomicrobiales bacterium]
MTVKPEEAFFIKSMPEWVEALDISDLVSGGSDTPNLLFQQECHVPSRSRFIRNAYRIDSAESLGECSNIEFDIEPGCFQLHVHHVRLIRDGKIVSEAEEDEFRFIQPEEARHRLVFDGRYKAIHILEDARPGDVVDYASTSVEVSPIFPGYFYGGILACAPAGAELLRVVVHTDKTHPVQQRSAGGEREFVTRENDDGTVSSILEVRKEKWREFNHYAPAWFQQFPVVNWSSFDSWEGVSQAVSALWNTSISDDFNHSAIEESINALSLTGLSKSDQIDRVIRFVQDEIRYLSLSEGIRSLVPNKPSKVVTKRYGDCKDKSILLALMLRKIGVAAAVGLVSSYRRGHIAEALPSVDVFDHVIAMIRHEGNDYWIDATATGAGGSFTRRQQPVFEKALLILDQGSPLVEIAGSKNNSSICVQEDLYLDKKKEKIRIEVVTEATGREADGLRYSKNQTTADRFQENLRDFTNRFYPDATVEKTLEWEDDLLNNRVVLREFYVSTAKVEDSPIASMGRHYPILPTLIGTRLPGFPANELPDGPFALSHPNHARHEIRFHHDKKLKVKWSDTREVVDGPGFRYEFFSQTKKDRVEFSFDYETSRDFLNKEELPEFKKKIDEVNGSLGRGVPVSQAATAATAATPVQVLIVVLVLGGFSASGLSSSFPKETVRPTIRGNVPKLRVENLYIEAHEKLNTPVSAEADDQGLGALADSTADSQVGEVKTSGLVIESE